VTAPLALSFETSATGLAGLPPSPAEVAVVGRSNVGKSSLLNALANRKRLAHVSTTPGRTQLLNLFRLPSGATVVDLPGYGYAAVPGRVRATWGAMIEGYLLRREPLRQVLLLVDGEIGPAKLDLAMLAWARDHELPFSVVATKADKVKPSRRAARQADLAAGCEVAPGDVLWVSAAKGAGIDALRARVLAWLDPAAA
jgi:GTP-binding protein